MGNTRKFSSHVRWTDDEILIVRQLYPSASHDALKNALPSRSLSQIQNMANRLEVIRIKPVKLTNEQRLDRKRQFMYERRLSNPEAVRKYQNSRYHANRDDNLASMKEYQKRRFFWIRSVRLKQKGKATPQQLSKLWKKQRGICALTGVRLDRNAELDHIIPRAKGGKDNIENLRWVTMCVNRAKRDMLDGDFFDLCLAVVNYRGITDCKSPNPQT